MRRGAGAVKLRPYYWHSNFARGGRRVAAGLVLFNRFYTRLDLTASNVVDRVS